MSQVQSGLVEMIVRFVPVKMHTWRGEMGGPFRRGPPFSATSSRAGMATRARVATRETALSAQRPPNVAETRLDDSFIISLDKFFVLDMPEYQ